MQSSLQNEQPTNYGSVLWNSDVDAQPRIECGDSEQTSRSIPLPGKPASLVQNGKPILFAIASFALLMLSAILIRPGIEPLMIQKSLPLLSKPTNSETSFSERKLLVDGFLTSKIIESSSMSKKNHGLQFPLYWYNAPDSWEPEPGKREGRDGAWSVNDDQQTLTLTPPAKKDYWRKTYYEPILIKDDGPFLYASLPYSDTYYTVETTLDLTAVRQFDQAGIMVRLDPEHWLKTGIEVVDHQPRLSCVVTNDYSDWSTQTWFNYTKQVDGTITTVYTHCQIRVHCRGESFVVEAKLPDPTTGQPVWQFIRIAHLSRSHAGTRKYPEHSGAKKGQLWAGVFAASPEDQQGGHVVFSQFQIKEGSQFDHNADGNQESR